MNLFPTVVVSEDGPASAALSAVHVRDLAHVRRLLILAAIAAETESRREETMPLAKLALLRNFLATVRAADSPKARRLLLMALLQLEDEDEAARLVVPHPALPVIAPR